MNERKLKRLFPNASNDFIKRNKDRSYDTGESNKSESMDEARTSQACGSKEMDAQYCLRRVEVAFYTNHGKKLDQDNRRYIVKPILDALVNLGFARDDKEITSETTQRMDKDNSNI